MILLSSSKIKFNLFLRSDLSFLDPLSHQCFFGTLDNIVIKRELVNPVEYENEVFLYFVANYYNVKLCQNDRMILGMLLLSVIIIMT